MQEEICLSYLQHQKENSSNNCEDMIQNVIAFTFTFLVENMRKNVLFTSLAFKENPSNNCENMLQNVIAFTIMFSE